MLVVGNIGDTLKTLRLAKALTQQELSDISGVAVSTIVKIEHGRSKPKMTVIRRLSRALKVSPDRLVLAHDD